MSAGLAYRLPPPSIKEKISGPLLLSSTQIVDLMIFSLFLRQLNDRIHFHHIFSWHSLNVSPNFKYHDWKPLTNRSYPLWIPQEKKKQTNRNTDISTSSLTFKVSALRCSLLGYSGSWAAAGWQTQGKAQTSCKLPVLLQEVGPHPQPARERSLLLS